MAATFLLASSLSALAEDPTVPLAKGVRGLATRTPAPIEMDGSLSDWTTAFCTPVNYQQANLKERAAQFFYLWDDEALYIGLRCLDTKQANPGKDGAVYDGDAVEFYLDTRTGEKFQSKDWTEGAIHLFYSPFEGSEVRPRWVMRGGIATSGTKLQGVQVAGKSYPWGYEAEFKMPWSNFPPFQAKLGALIAIDAELCSGDGQTRTDRTFAYGSPLSVQQPASLGLVELVKSFEPDYLPEVGPASFPMWVETPWNQDTKGEVQAVVAIPPAFAEIAGMVDIRIHDADGKVIKTFPAPLEEFGPPKLGFLRATARWPLNEFAPNRYFATAKVASRTEKTLVTVTPRMVPEAIIFGR